MSDDISFQTWICPACCDDHSPSSGCYREIAKKDARIKELEAIAYCPYQHEFKISLDGYCNKCGWSQLNALNKG